MTTIDDSRAGSQLAARPGSIGRERCHDQQAAGTYQVHHTYGGSITVQRLALSVRQLPASSLHLLAAARRGRETPVRACQQQLSQSAGP